MSKDFEVSTDVLPKVGVHTGAVAKLTYESRDYGGEPEMKFVAQLVATDAPEGVTYSPLEKVFNDSVSVDSGLGRFLAAIGRPLTPGGKFRVDAIKDVPVTFEVIVKDNGFHDVPSASIKALQA